ncbi:MAG: MBL fold metallo-hydrolase [bacterium]
MQLFIHTQRWHSIKPLLLIFALSLGISLVNHPSWAEENTTPFTRAEVDHNFGTPANRQFLPKTPYNTDDAPVFSLSPTDNATKNLPVYKLTPSTYFFYGNIAEVDENNRGFNGNAGFVITKEGVVVIDALGSPKLGQRMINTIKSVTDQPIKQLIITHNHPDHAYGAVAFKSLKENVSVIGHEGTLKYIESDRIEHSVEYRNTFIKADMTGFQAIIPDILIDGKAYSKKTFYLGDHTFDVYNTGAHHSYGDLVIHQKPENFVWISDLAFNNRLTFMADGHSQKAIEAQTWLLEHFADAHLMIPGHGSIQTAPFPMVSKTRHYMQQLREKMKLAIDQDIDLQTAIDSNDFPEWQKSRLYEANHKKNIDFVYREIEQEQF